MVYTLMNVAFSLFRKMCKWMILSMWLGEFRINEILRTEAYSKERIPHFSAHLMIRKRSRFRFLLGWSDLTSVHRWLRQYWWLILHVRERPEQTYSVVLFPRLCSTWFLCYSSWVYVSRFLIGRSKPVVPHFFLGATRLAHMRTLFCWH